MRPLEPRALLTLHLTLPLVTPDLHVSHRVRSDAALLGAPVRRRVRVRVGLLCRREARDPQLVPGDGRVQELRGELVSLEWLQKIGNIQERLSEFGVNLSSGVSVNAHRPFYSANNRFAWSSGIELPLEVDTAHMEQCVKYSSIGLLPITCYTDIEAFPLLCQRVSPRKAGISELKSLLLPNLNSYKLTFKSINYSVESCDYFSFVRVDYNWYHSYQAKMLCETVNSELIGIPRNEECQLIDECLNLRVKSKPPKLMLNMYLKMYARNGSLEIFRDPSGKTINDSNCSWSDLVKYEYNDADEKYCVYVEQSKTISQFKCKNKDTTDFVGVICRQCRPNSKYPYIKSRIFKRSTESTWMTFIQTQSLASTRPIASIGHSGFSTSPLYLPPSSHHLYLILLALCAVLIVLLAFALALALSVLRIRRVLVKDSVTACHSDTGLKCDGKRSRALTTASASAQCVSSSVGHVRPLPVRHLGPATAGHSRGDGAAAPSAAAGPDVRHGGRGLHPGPDLLRSHRVPRR